MTKVKSTGKFHYELLYIVPNKFTRQEAEDIDDKVRKEIEGRQGEIVYSEQWGNKKMAYPIKHYTHGYYYLLEFDMPGENLQEMNYWLKMYENVLRFQVVKKKKKTAKEIEKEKRASQKQTKRAEEKKDEEVKKKDEEVRGKREEEEEKEIENSKLEIGEEKEEKEVNKSEKTKEVKDEKEEEKKKKKTSSNKKEDKDKDKADLEDLDKKLDDILDSHDLL
jgi:small subunit ribosomal protein S6